MHKRNNRNHNSSQHLTTYQFRIFKSEIQVCIKHGHTGAHTHSTTYPALLFIFFDEVRESFIKTQSTTSRVQTAKLLIKGDISFHSDAASEAVFISQRGSSSIIQGTT